MQWVLMSYSCRRGHDVWSPNGPQAAAPVPVRAAVGSPPPPGLRTWPTFGFAVGRRSWPLAAVFRRWCPATRLFRLRTFTQLGSARSLAINAPNMSGDREDVAGD